MGLFEQPELPGRWRLKLEYQTRCFLHHQHHQHTKLMSHRVPKTLVLSTGSVKEVLHTDMWGLLDENSNLLQNMHRGLVPTQHQISTQQWRPTYVHIHYISCPADPTGGPTDIQ